MERLIYPFTAGGNVVANQIVTHVNGIDGVVGASTATSTVMLMGVTTDIGGSTGQTVDVVIGDVADLKLGGAVKMFDPITTDSSGYGIAAVANTVALVQSIGYALDAGASGEIIPIMVQQNTIAKM